MESNLALKSFAERSQLVKEIQVECTRAEKGEQVDLKQTTEKLAGLLRQLNKDGEAINAGTKIGREVRKKYDLQKSDLTGLNARVKELSVKANMASKWVKPAVYTAGALGAMAMAVFIAHKTGILSSPPTAQPPPQTPPTPPSQPACHPTLNPFSPAPTPTSVPLTPSSPTTATSVPLTPSSPTTPINTPTSTPVSIIPVIKNVVQVEEALKGGLVAFCYQMISLHFIAYNFAHWEINPQWTAAPIEQQQMFYVKNMRSNLLSIPTLVAVGGGAVIGGVTSHSWLVGAGLELYDFLNADFNAPMPARTAGSNAAMLAATFGVYSLFSRAPTSYMLAAAAMFGLLVYRASMIRKYTHPVPFQKLHINRLLWNWPIACTYTALAAAAFKGYDLLVSAYYSEEALKGSLAALCHQVIPLHLIASSFVAWGSGTWLPRMGWHTAPIKQQIMIYVQNMVSNLLSISTLASVGGGAVIGGVAPSWLVGAGFGLYGFLNSDFKGFRIAAAAFGVYNLFRAPTSEMLAAAFGVNLFVYLADTVLRCHGMSMNNGFLPFSDMEIQTLLWDLPSACTYTALAAAAFKGYGLLVSAYYSDDPTAMT